jgi:hypothetical protein
MHAICPTFFIILRLITLIIYREDYKL